jgi:ribosomal-protein-alanine N-acetyltransferase
MKCRLADCADALSIHEIELQSFKTPWSFESIQADVCLNDNAYYFVAEEDGKVVGFIGIHIVLDEGHIMNVAVSPDYRGRGIAEALLRMMMEFVDLNAYTLEVRLSNKPAIRLYKRLGFVEVGIRPEYYIDEDALIMWWYKPTP